MLDYRRKLHAVFRSKTKKIVSKGQWIRTLMTNGGLRQAARVQASIWVAKAVGALLPVSSPTYYLTHNAGFFSCSSVALEDISSREVESVNARFGLGLYKSSIFEDPWPLYFVTDSKFTDKRQVMSKELLHARGWWAHRYDSLPFDKVAPLIKRYFEPSSEVRVLERGILIENDFDPENAIGLHYRGTDKVTETDIAPVERFAIEVESILKREPHLRVFLQTDEKSAFEFFNQRFGERVLFLEDLPVSSNGLGAHYLRPENVVLETRIYFASVLILSQCKYLVTHTGNGALWEVLYRGNFKNVTQF